MSPQPARITRVVGAVTVATVTSLLALVPTPAAAAVPAPPVKLPVAIETMPPYQPQSFCDPTVKPGTRALADLLTKTYAGTSIVSLVRPCGSDKSEHYDGRAVDWGVNHTNDKQRTQGKAFLHWLFAADNHGNRYAMVRRLGVMYVIWNKQIWGAWSQKWEPYSCSGVTACHVDHMHISLDWSGAMKKTSFWTGNVSAPMPPPPLVLRRLHQSVTQHVSLRNESPDPSYKAPAGSRYRVTVHGTYRTDGERHHQADAECSTTDGDHWAARASGDDRKRTGLLDLWLNRHRDWRPVGAGRDGCSDSHTYHRVITFRDRSPITLSINDPQRWYGDGDLAVTIERIG